MAPAGKQGKRIPVPDYGFWLHGDAGYDKYIIRGAMLAKWPPREGELILDVGTGRGIVGIGYTKQISAVRVVGIDIWQEESIRDNSPAWVMENANRENVRKRVFCATATAERLPFGGATFDRVVSSMCLHNIQGPRKQLDAFTEIARVLRPGGVFVYVDSKWEPRWTRVLAWLETLDLKLLADDVILSSQHGDRRMGLLAAQKRGKAHRSLVNPE